jgi:DivIVA domain-containing protein
VPEAIRSYSGVVPGPGSKDQEENPRSAPPEEQGREFGDLRPYVPADILGVSFPAAMRGYDRAAVDAYVERVGHALAELKVRSSPPAAVRHALEQAGGKVNDLLRSAHEAADEITASARKDAEETTQRARTEAADLVVSASSEADRVKAEAEQALAQARAEAEETLARAKGEAQATVERANSEAAERRRKLEEELAGLREQAEARMREIEADTGRIRDRRRELLDATRATAGELAGLVEAAAALFLPARPPAEQSQAAEPPDQPPAPDSSDGSEPAASAPDAEERSEGEPSATGTS